MKDDIIKYIITTIIGAVIASLVAYIKLLNNKVKNNIAEHKNEDNAVREAVKMLLRAEIKRNCQYYINKGEIPSSEYDELEESLRVYETFHANGLCHKLFETIQEEVDII